MVSADVITLALPSTVQFDHYHPLFSILSPSERVEVIVRSAFCLVLAWFCLVQSKDCERFENDSMTKLEGLQRVVET